MDTDSFNFNLKVAVRWQPRRARLSAKGSPQRECGGIHKCGAPPKSNANFAWGQHFFHNLALGTAGGMVGFALANGSMSSNQSWNLG